MRRGAEGRSVARSGSATLGPMRAVVSVLLVVLAMPSLAHAQAMALGAPERGTLVLVVDSGQARVAADRLARSISSALLREVVRITDERARDAVGTLTIAHDAGARWQVRFESRGRSATLVATVARGTSVDDSLADASRRVVVEVESMPDPALLAAQRRATSNSRSALWADEILDPFPDAPRPPRREMAIFSEVIDPFAPAASRRRPFTEVLDPWSP